MRRVVALTERVAATDATVLITGESGTGKTLVAAWIHRLGRRRDGPFVTVPCANLQPELFESELFGHEPGAHTDAVTLRPGRFEAARGGTIFLDGVGTLGPALQAKLLRAVQEKAFERLGGTRTIQADVRIVAAGDESLAEEVRAGRFRHDLFYRLNVVPIALPPLRERPEDIAPLARYFLGRFSSLHRSPRRRLDPDARRLLRTYGWPGNVRELANVLERAVIAGDGSVITAEALGLQAGAPAERAAREALRRRWSLRELEADYISAVLREVRGNKSRAAAILGINRKTLLEKIRRSGR